MSPFRYGVIPLALAATFATQVARAQDDYDDRFYVTPYFSYVLADDDRFTDDGYGGTLAIGKRLTPRLELELRGNYLQYEAKQAEPGVIGGLLCGLFPNGPGCPDASDVEITSGGVGANFFLSPSGGLYVHADAQFGDSNLYNAGLGYDFSFSSIGLRAEALYHNDDGDYDEVQFNLGLRIPFGRKAEPPAPAPEPVQVVPVEPAPPPPPPPPPPCELPQAGQPITLDGCKAGDTLVLRGVNFEFDKSRLTPNAKTLLDQVADALLIRTDIKFEIDGHTDSKGSDSYNLKLSDRRAKSVLDYLIGRGVAADRASWKGFGESMPIADNATDDGRELNRRVELKITEMGGAPAAVAPAAAAEPAALPEPAPAAADPASAAEPAPSAPVAVEPAAATGAATVTIASYAYAPATLTVAAGTKVTWNNQDKAAHSIVFGDQEIEVPGGQSASRTFDQPGSYSYQCGFHPDMKGTIVVQ